MEGKVALVTGGSSGIGQATALAFARNGAKVAVADVDVAGGTATVAMIKEAGGEAAFIQADVSNEEDVKAMVAATVSSFGRLDYAVNNAGIEGVQAAIHETTVDSWEKTISINLSGVFYCLKHEIAHMLTQGGGAIVNTSSIAGLKGFAGLSPYVASKHGVTGLTKAAAVEYAAQGIRVNSVHPGAIRTPMVARYVEEAPEVGAQMDAMHPIGRIGEPAEVGDAIVWLCSDKSSFVTGHTLAIDGGIMAA